jgi:hypothetical protein
MNDIDDNAQAYALQRELKLTGMAGQGLQGKVWTVADNSNSNEWALKIQDRRSHRIERACYERLQELRITEVAGFNVPLMLHFDDQWNAIEMTIVTRPFVLDFAQAYLDFPPDFSEEVWAETLQSWIELYGPDWPRVRRALDALEALGIHYLDVHRGNIALEI